MTTVRVKHLCWVLVACLLGTLGVATGARPSAAASAPAPASATSAPGEVQAYGWSYSAYRAEYDALWPQGWRLYSLETYVDSNGAILYNAVWRPGNSAELQTYGATYGSFKGQYDSLWPQGWRLFILQSYVYGGQVLYNAVWRPGTTGEIQAYNTSYSDFRDEYDTLRPQGWRLFIVQAYLLDNGKIRYNAVWRPGDTLEHEAYGWSYAQYRALYDSLWPAGWRLYHLQSYVVGGETWYDAIWRPGDTAEYQAYGATYQQYRSQYDALFPQGWRLYILQAYMVGAETRYNAVWRPA